MSIKKQFLKTNGTCKVTFHFGDDLKNVESIRIPGDFNNWDMNCEPMKKLKTGGFSQTLNLEAGKSYQFRYLIDSSVWENEPEADLFVPNGISPGEVNSVIEL
ncbi:isoamylase early set domain-containing protein [Gaoshiqia sediminis]|uniref:Isoamylase early set domain-containing protein n=1 Tax=Gaoshiqia sediminis TaxID=2986998 RepID=A0AA41YBS7_9BACT|nr:isoamylase early set domain-containing protein [Gaoshiqia sediminis]MCW0483353.1 isoamylase early set domain-containing protein [Gaoshiqia sediminis]